MSLNTFQRQVGSVFPKLLLQCQAYTLTTFLDKMPACVLTIFTDNKAVVDLDCC